MYIKLPVIWGLKPASSAHKCRNFLPRAIMTAKPPLSISKLDGFIHRIQECNTGLHELPTLTPFVVDGKVVGHIKPRFRQQLARFSQVFHIEGEGPSGTVTFQPDVERTCKGRSAAVAGEIDAYIEACVLQALHTEGEVSGWRNELYPVTASFYEEPLLLVERAAATHFGIKAYGVHVNGYVEKDNALYLWIARRSKTKPNWPGKLDHIVAGGQPHGISPGENVIKECEEEASIPRELALRAQPVGCVSYMNVSATGLKPDVLFCYDIKLPHDFVPMPLDGEVEEFILWPIDKVAEVVATTTEFKTNCNLVIIDFMVRHGYITPEQPGYLQLIKLLRSGDCS